MLHLIALVFSISMLGGYIGYIYIYIYIYILGRVLEFGVDTQSFHRLERNLNV
jgi:hypothetical protein